ncbi:response regulator transcription factor [Kitasatospora sp. NPDC088556]|uniref:response regulator transcription factor n=1 Tax=Kitasatospora sp. NPDC088556 TaxID=3364076 RepID=UPI0037FDD559
MTVYARPGAALTPTEIDTLALLADGYTITEIAAELSISYDAVSSRLSCARRKLRASTNCQAVVLAYRTAQLALGPVRSAA